MTNNECLGIEWVSKLKGAKGQEEGPRGDGWIQAKNLIEDVALVRADDYLGSLFRWVELNVRS